MLHLNYLQEKLHQREKLGNKRTLSQIEAAIDFSSNDYLGLASSGELFNNVIEELSRNDAPKNRLGSTGSRLIHSTAYALRLEEKVASFHGFPCSLLFNCGYMANMGLLSMLGNKNAAIFFDEAVHASVRDGIRLSRNASFPFRHNDTSHLLRRLEKATSFSHRIICVESVYSTDGSIAPLEEMCAIAEHHKAHVIVDEAHAVGVLGPEGRGLVAASSLPKCIFAKVITFGKALGTFGAAVLASQSTKEALINFATSQIYTTSLPYQLLAAIKCSYDLFPAMCEARERLQKNIALFCKHIPTGSSTHIQPLYIRGNRQAKEAEALLSSNDLHVRALLSPTVRRGEERLRIALHARNEENELLQLIKIIKDKGYA